MIGDGPEKEEKDKLKGNLAAHEIEDLDELNIKGKS